MATVVRGVGAVRTYLEMIKWEHSVFALPFAMLGMLWAAHGWPGTRTFVLIVLAMVSCRSSAMAFNRIADRKIDALNPRTQSRALPAGRLSLGHTELFFAIDCVIFLACAAALNTLTLALSPVALGVTIFYSMTKRFTPLSHFVLGLSLGIAPAAAWIAVKGSLSFEICWLSLAVVCWTAGFDILYALQDVEFDRELRLRSIPETIGVPRALMLSRALHACAVACLTVAGIEFHAGDVYFGGVVFAAALLAYEQSLVKPTDLSKINHAFFTLNGFVSIGVFGFGLADYFIRR